jgi:sigma-B regulation protein RsbU (phosphoserine phosphatase)
VLGDVSGKAAPAALYAALVSGVLRSLTKRHLPPADLLAELNSQLQVRKLDAQYVTMLMALWDDEKRVLSLANAGSAQPLHIARIPKPGDEPAKKGSKQAASNPCADAEYTVTTIPAEGFPLGLFPAAQYDEITLTASPGDVFVFFSDGIVDAENSEGEMFGTDRLRAVLRDNPTACQSAQTTVDAIVTAVEAFQSGTIHFDDETLIVLRVL